ncbi:hypothetical protein [Paraburkholderia phosphatilytica]|uniref:hypothetical protein n=1 Tax=Paraburkholderia phosphatilytica TaxID=2282883 RepID=UPI000E4F86AE|nr:hypothetical protein [Paraburkholderia phosphatilytica]
MDTLRHLNSKGRTSFLAKHAIALALTLSLGITHATAGELLKLPTRNGATSDAYLDSSSTTPPWVIVLFAGDDGAMNLTDSGPTRLKGNFLIRTASYWTQSGDATAIFDAPSDNASGMNDVFRLSADGAQDIAVVVAELRKRYPNAKVALIGTSRGTISVGNVLKRNPALADAYVLTSPVTNAGGGQAGLSGLSWEGNKARVLMLSNEHDGCFVSPFSGAKRVANSNGFDFVAVSSSEGGGSRKAECGANSPHGYLGIEQQVLDTINGWLNGKPVAAQP